MPVDFKKHNPKTLDEAVNCIYANLTLEEKDYIKKNGYISLHHGVGTTLRNEWHLWEANSPLADYFSKAYGLGHADDMSGMIFSSLYLKLNNIESDPKVQANYYKKYWLEQGIDPLTQENLVVD